MSNEAVAPGTFTSLPGAVRVLPDQRLVALGKRGDRAALNAICRRYQQVLFRYCEAILGNAEDAKDALQNALIGAVAALPGESRKIELKPWLYRIAHNEAISVARRRRADVELDLDHLPPMSDGNREVQIRQDLRELVADLQTLAERQRGALIMRELSGMSFDEIGDAFDTSPAAIRQSVYEARLALHELKKGREMDCEQVTQAISAGDRRILRGRAMRAHIRECAECREFDEAIPRRRAELAALAPPLPAIALAGIMQSVLGGGAAAGGSAELAGIMQSVLGGGAAAGGSAAAAGAGATGLAAAVAAKSTAGALALKSAAAVAAVAVVAGTADFVGVVEGPIGGSDGRGADARESAPGSDAAGGAGAGSGTAAGGHGSNSGASDSNGDGLPSHSSGKPPSHSRAGGNPPSHSNAGGNPPSNSSAGGNPPPNSSAGGNAPSGSNAGGNPPPNSSAGGNPSPGSSAGGSPPSSSSAGGNPPSNSSAGGNPPSNSSAGSVAPEPSAPAPETAPATGGGASATAPGHNKLVETP